MDYLEDWQLQTSDLRWRGGINSTEKLIRCYDNSSCLTAMKFGKYVCMCVFYLLLSMESWAADRKALS